MLKIIFLEINFCFIALPFFQPKGKPTLKLAFITYNIYGYAYIQILFEHDTMDQATFFKCLSDPTRLDILTLILRRGKVCVCEFTEHLSLSQPKISRHLAQLRHCSILLDQRQGQWVYYRINPNLAPWAMDILNIIANHQNNHPRATPQTTSQTIGAIPNTDSSYCE